MNHFRARIEIHISSEKKNKYEYNGWKKDKNTLNQPIFWISGQLRF